MGSGKSKKKKRDGGGSKGTSDLLSCIPYQGVPHEKVDIPKRDMTHRYDDFASLAGRRVVPEFY